MKRLILTLVIAFSTFTIGAYAQPSEELTTAATEMMSTAEGTMETVAAAADSVKVSVTDAVNEVDTAGLYRAIYTDVKTGIFAIADALKVGAEHVYKVLVLQQVVYALKALALFILGAIFLIIAYRCARKLEYDSSDDTINSVPLLITAICSVVIGTIMFVSQLFQMDVIVMGLVNPEYGAILEIIDIVKEGAKNSGHGCNTCP